MKGILWREALAALRLGRGFAALATVPVMAFVICLAPTRGVAGGRGPAVEGDTAEYCSQTAEAVFSGCRHEVRADYSFARAICINVSEAAAQARCFADANASRLEANQLCDEQLDAREEVCEAVGEGRYDPDFDPALFDPDFTNPTNPNPYFPLRIGNRWEYRGGTQSNTIVVLNRTKLIEGGEVTRSTQSFGPIFSERAETIGRKRFAVGFNYQYFSFDTFGDFDLLSVPAVFEHDSAASSGGLADIVTSVVAIKTRVGQFSAYFTYGLTDRVDISYSIPFLDVRLDASAEAVLRRVGSAQNPSVHFFPNAGFPDPSTPTTPGDTSSGFYGDRSNFGPLSGSASGVGDIIVRAKATVAKSGPSGLALGVDLRLPTGDEENFLGAGALGLRPFAAISLSGKVSPHVNVAYQWNRESTLAGTTRFGPNGQPLGATTERGDLPDHVSHILGRTSGFIPTSLSRWTCWAAG